LNTHDPFVAVVIPASMLASEEATIASSPAESVQILIERVAQSLTAQIILPGEN
jgi:hypothetical protein